MLHYGHPKLGRCQDKSCKAQVTKIGTVGEREKLSATQPRNKCREEEEEHKAIVAAGGVYWKCPGGHEGVVKSDADFAKAVREACSIEAPAPCGVELLAEQCPACQDQDQGSQEDMNSKEA